MKNLISEEIKRIKEIMLISEAAPPGGLIGSLADAAGFLDNLIPTVQKYYDELVDANSKNRFMGNIRLIASSANVPNPNSLNLKGLISGIANSTDEVAKKDLLKYLNTNSPDVAKSVTNFIKNDRRLLSAVSDIDSTLLRTELNDIGLGSQYDNIAKSLIKKPNELTDMFKDWKVKWAETDGLRGEYVSAIDDLNVDQTFKDKYKQILNDEAWMTNAIKKLSAEIPYKTPEDASAYLEKSMSEYLTKLATMAKTKEQLSLIQKYKDFIFQRKKWADTNYPNWKAALSTVLPFYIGALLPASAIFETVAYGVRSDADFEQAFATSEEGQTAMVELEKGEITPEEFQQKFLNYSRKELAKDIGNTSVIVPKIAALIGLGAVESVSPKGKSKEQMAKEGQELFDRLKNKKTTTSTNIMKLDDLKPKLVSFLNKSENTTGYGTNDYPYIVSAGDNVVEYETTNGNKIKYKYDPNTDTFTKL